MLTLVSPSNQLPELSYEEIAEAENLRRSFKLFAQAAWHVIEPGTPLLWNWHLDVICDHLQAVYERRIKRLAITIAPGHAKSSFISVLFPVWCMLNDPCERWLCASHSIDLATRDNKNRRDLILSEWFQARYGHLFQLSHSQSVKVYWENDHRGYSLAIAVRSSGTGKRGTHLLIDDANNAMAGLADIEATKEWFGKTWVSRLNDQENGPMIIVGQRLHEDDLIGHVLKLGGWEHVDLPEEYEPSRIQETSLGSYDIRTKEGELLWPEKFPREVLDKLKRGLGPLNYSAQYQQSPVPASGGTFQQRHERAFSITHDSYILQTPKGPRAVLKKDCTLFLSVDPAISEKQEADFMVIQTWVQTPIKDLLLLHSHRGHWSHNDQQDEVEEQFQARRGVDFAAVETVAYQNALFQDLINKGIPCKPFRPHTDKVARAASAAIWHANGKIYFLEGADWLPELQKELYKFPRASHDDQVDALSLASIVVRSRGPLSDDTATFEDDIPDPIEGPLEPEEEEKEKPKEPEPSIFEVVENLQKDPFAYVAQLMGGDYGNY